jgi:hypothetical protein
VVVASGLPAAARAIAHAVHAAAEMEVSKARRRGTGARWKRRVIIEKWEGGGGRMGDCACGACGGRDGGESRGRGE